MKKIALLLFFTLGSYLANAQNQGKNHIPEVVKSAFTKKYPNVKSAKWDVENGNYETSFYINKISYSTVFDVHGNLLETEEEIEIGQLPKNITEYIAKNYKSKIKEAARITDAGGKITYEAEIDNKDLIFDSHGNFLKK